MYDRLQELLIPAQITLDLKGRDHLFALDAVAGLLKGNSAVVNFDGFREQLFARDRLDITCLGNDLAIPHARTEHVTKIVLAIGRSNEGIYFENCQQSARLLFVLGTPVDEPMEYLQLLSTLCKILKVEANRSALLNASSTSAFIAALVNAEKQLPRAHAGVSA